MRSEMFATRDLESDTSTKLWNVMINDLRGLFRWNKTATTL